MSQGGAGSGWVASGCVELGNDISKFIFIGESILLKYWVDKKVCCCLRKKCLVLCLFFVLGV